MLLSNENLLSDYNWSVIFLSGFSTGHTLSQHVNYGGGNANMYFSITTDGFFEASINIIYLTRKGRFVVSRNISQFAGTNIYLIDPPKETFQSFELLINVIDATNVLLSDMSLTYGYNGFGNLGNIEENYVANCNNSINCNNNGVRGSSSVTVISISFLIDSADESAISDIVMSTNLLYINDQWYTNMKSLTTDYLSDNRRIAKIEVCE